MANIFLLLTIHCIYLQTKLQSKLRQSDHDLVAALVKVQDLEDEIQALELDHAQNQDVRPAFVPLNTVRLFFFFFFFFFYYFK
jgi:hypothetical protein